jgi:hypothetical protein
VRGFRLSTPSVAGGGGAIYSSSVQSLESRPQGPEQPASESLVILDGEIGHKNFWLLDLATGARHLLAQLPADEDVRDFDVSPTRSEIVFDRIEASSEMAVIDRTPP